MQLSDYDYHLPPEAIALYPPEVRGSSRLLVLDRTAQHLTDGYYARLPDHLRAGDVLVVNNTKVIKARLLARTANGASRELLLLEKHEDNPDSHHQRAMYRGKLRPGMRLYVDDAEISVVDVLPGGLVTVASNRDLFALADRAGTVPLPPYLHRDPTAIDTERYQTVIAREPGSVAAPTASLNLTSEVLQALAAKGVIIAELTLHVGLGTFMPIHAETIEDHVMHSEYFHIPYPTITAIRAAKAASRRVIAVGTTVTRTLEYVALQLDTANNDLHGEADIFIYPGYRFKIVDVMLTNFHAPRSTVLMMAAAFAGWDNLQAAYSQALANGYKFLSYGDSMLIT